MLRKKRLYALFEQRDGAWVRISAWAYWKENAVRVFQSALLAGAFGGPTRCLKPVTEQHMPGGDLL